VSLELIDFLRMSSSEFALLSVHMEFWQDTGAELISRRGFEEDAELARAGGVPQLAERLGFNLADALAGEGERLSYFFERVLTAVFQVSTCMRRVGLEWRGLKPLRSWACSPVRRTEH